MRDELESNVNVLFKELKALSIEFDKDVIDVWDDYKRVENSFFIFETLSNDYHYRDVYDKKYFLKVSNTLGMVYDCGGLLKK